MTLRELPNIPQRIASPRSQMFMRLAELSVESLRFPTWADFDRVEDFYQAYSTHYLFVYQQAHAYHWFCENHTQEAELGRVAQCFAKKSVSWQKKRMLKSFAASSQNAVYQPQRHAAARTNVISMDERPEARPFRRLAHY